MNSTASEPALERQRSAWLAVICLSLLTFVLVASEFMPVSLLTPIAHELRISEGQAGQAISVSGLFAIVTSLFGNTLLARLDRRAATLLYTGVMIVSGLAIALAPNYLVFMLGRALIGISIGGFWSLSTSIIARLVSGAELPRAIAMLQGGTAFASVIALPAGSFLGGLLGWRGAFFVVVPIGAASLLWQLAVLPKMPPAHTVSVGHMFGLMRRGPIALGMAATALAFMGQFALSTYLRPFLEGVTGLDVNALSLVLLGLGIAGLVGTSVVGFVVRRSLGGVLVGLPGITALLAVLFILLGHVSVVTALLLLLWGFLANPIPVAWNTWMARVIPTELEAGGGLQVALIQFAITFGASIGGALLDHAGWQAPFILAALLLAVSAILAARAASSLSPTQGHPT